MPSYSPPPQIKEFGTTWQIWLNGLHRYLVGAPTVTLPIFANNAAAIAGGLTSGRLYRNGANPDLVCVVS